MRENCSKTKPYFIILFTITLLIGIFYYFYLKYYARFYFLHFYEYYTRAIVITDFLKNGHFAAAVSHCLHSYVDKILIYRSVPFLLFFGSSQFVFFYSNVIFNLFLLLLFFHSLLKIMQAERAFYLTLLILSQYFFIELLASFYVDLSYFLLCSMFFIYLSLFDKHRKKHNVELAVFTFLLFLTKNVSYFIIPVIWVFFTIYFLVSKKESLSYVIRFSSILGFGFFLYYAFALGFDYHIFIEDIECTYVFTEGTSLPLSQGIWNTLNDLYTRGVIRNYHLVLKFPVLWFNLILYPLVIITYYKRRNTFWFLLFCISEVFFFLLYNIKGYHHSFRFFLPFYFIYLYFVYEFLALLFDKQSNNSLLNKLLALIIIISAYNSFSFLAVYTNRDVRAENHDIYAEHKSIPLQKYFSALPMGATIYLDRGGGPGPLDWVICFYESFIDHSGDKYLHLAKIDPRFKYKIVSDINSAGYIARNNNSSIDNSKYELLGTEKGVCLLRKKNWQTAY